MEVYILTPIGRKLVQNPRNPRSPEYLTLNLLSTNGRATKDQIMNHVPGATPSMITKLRMKHVICEETGVNSGLY